MAATETIVQTKSGAVSGTGTDVRVYRGIPYGKPPVGARRWTAPEPGDPWTGVHDGSAFGYDPIQNFDPATSRAPGVSEDCLTLNIWAPAEIPAGGLPVLVWFDGGGFVTGSGARPRSDGERIARSGAVVVTANYRVGVFGFLAHPELTAESPHHASGNYGFADVILALRWVKDNIAAFGGDPKRVTPFGASAGGAVVGLLLVSPMARGLFDKMILQSPGSFRPLSPLKDAEAAGLAAAGPDLKALRAKPPEELLPLNAKINPAVRGLTIPRPLRPINDGWAIPRDEVDAFLAGDFTAVPTLVGGMANEGGYFSHNIPVKTVEQLRTYVENNFPDYFDEAWSIYGVDDDAKVEQAVADLFGDAQFSYGARSLARVISAREPKTYRYVFTHKPSAKGGKLPVHGDESPFVFGTGAQLDEGDRRVSDAIIASWVNFAATGDPSGPSAPRWEPFDTKRDNYITLDEGFPVGTNWRKKQLDFVEKYFREAR